MRKTTYIVDYNLITPLGFGIASNWNSLLQGKTGVSQHKIIENEEPFFASIIENDNLENAFSMHNETVEFTRLEKMLYLSLKPLIDRNPISSKSVLILSTTKGNISSLKNKDELPSQVYLSALANKLAQHFGFHTPPIVVSNACVSGVMAIGVAKNLIQADLYDDAYVIAGDEISEFVVSGFNSFKAIGNEVCKPYDKNRTGINIGEAAAAVYITTKIKNKEKFSFKILGDSAINDANHISGPSRTGDGLFKSVKTAINESNIQPKDINFISAHGTATLYNDEMEAIAFNRMNMQNIPLNSLKAYYGHCLGASGLLESIIAMESSLNNQLIPSKNFEEMGVSQSLNIIKEITPVEIRYILKTASGFGGCNAAVVLEKCS